MRLLALVTAETLKLRHSLVNLLLIGIPTIVFVLLVAVLLSDNGPDHWDQLAMSGSAIWAYFLLPMTATAFTALQAQIEHAPNAWSHALTSPEGALKVFAAKAIISILALAAISVLIMAAILAGGMITSLWASDALLAGELPVWLLTKLMLWMWLAGFLLLAIQFAVSMAFASFAVPIVVGIGGTFIAIVATSAQAGIYFPWLLPVNILSSDTDRATQALITGFGGGLIVFIASCFWLSRRDWK